MRRHANCNFASHGKGSLSLQMCGKVRGEKFKMSLHRVLIMNNTLKILDRKTFHKVLITYMFEIYRISRVNFPWSLKDTMQIEIFI